jgi:hypothetical protein
MAFGGAGKPPENPILLGVLGPQARPATPKHQILRNGF